MGLDGCELPALLRSSEISSDGVPASFGPVRGEEVERRSIRGGGFGAPTSDKIQLRDALALLFCRNQVRRPIELIDDVENSLLSGFRRSVCREQPSDL